MEIYLINIDGKKYSQYKTYENALREMENQIKLNPNSVIQMILEDFCDYGNLDTCCKIHILHEYKNLIIDC